MKSIFPIFTWGLCALWGVSAHAQLPLATAGVGRGGQAAPGALDNSGETLMRRVMAAADGQRSISAKVRYKVDLMGHALRGAGIYLQQGRGAQRLLRFELTTKTTSGNATIRRVCDGENLWMFEDYGESHTLSRVDMARVRQARPKTPGGSVSPTAWLALGGLPQLLSSIEGSFQFATVSENRLDEQLRVWTIEGPWKPAPLGELLPDQKEAIAQNRAVDWSKLPPGLPDRVVLHIGCDDLFPYRLEYWRKGADANAAGKPSRGKLLLVMELYEVLLNSPLDPGEFAFQPGEIEPRDATPVFLDQLGLEETIPSGVSKNRPPRR